MRFSLADIFRFFSIGIFYILLPLNQATAKGKKLEKRESDRPFCLKKWIRPPITKDKTALKPL
jgi:hypothetical protein